jgi:hypothetical protein
MKQRREAKKEEREYG